MSGSTSEVPRGREAGFEDLQDHRTVVVRWRPIGKTRVQVLFVPAFGDEMNQMRRMVKLTAEALTPHGVASWVFDLFGTGDSSADFADATIERWLDDVRSVAARIRATDDAPLVVIGCRLGVALAVKASRAMSRPPAALIGWAPVLQGKVQLTGLLRAAGLARLQRQDVAEPDARAEWAAGRAATLGGYSISPALAAQLEALDATTAPMADRAVLIEVRLPVGEEAVVPSEALRKRAAAWSDEGVPTRVDAVAGPAFWNVSDLVDVPELIDRTVIAVNGFA